MACGVRLLPAPPQNRKATNVLRIEFGEAVRRRKKRGEALGKFDLPFADGVFLGVEGATDEVTMETGNNPPAEP